MIAFDSAAFSVTAFSPTAFAFAFGEDAAVDAREPAGHRNHMLRGIRGATPPGVSMGAYFRWTVLTPEAFEVEPQEATAVFVGLARSVSRGVASSPLAGAVSPPCAARARVRQRVVFPTCGVVSAFIRGEGRSLRRAVRPQCGAVSPGVCGSARCVGVLTLPVAIQNPTEEMLLFL